jgi:hypothetical protein
MPRITKAILIYSVVACVTAAVGIALVYLLFHGYFDRGKFELTATERSPSGALAMLGRRWDNEALSGDSYFVFIGDRVLSSAELRRVYYSDAVIFSAGRDCLSLQWKSATELAITCNDPTAMEPGRIRVEKRQAGPIAISYTNIPPLARN